MRTQMHEQPVPADLFSRPIGTVLVFHDDENIVVTIERDTDGRWFTTGNDLPLPDRSQQLVLSHAVTVMEVEPPEVVN